MPARVGTPQPPLIQQLETTIEFTDEPVFEGLHLRDILEFPVYDEGENWMFDGSKIERSMLAGQRFGHLKIWDSIFVGTDFSACRGFESGILRSGFLGCRMSGAQLGESTIQDVVFQNCKLNLLSLRKCTLDRVVFQNCVLDEADFAGAVMRNVNFIDCEMNQTEFNRVHCKGVDMTRSNLSRIRGVMSLKHVRIKPEQMMDIAPMLAAEVGFEFEQ